MRMKTPDILVQVVLLLFLACCSDDSPIIPTIPPCNDISLCDTCDTGAPRNPADSSLNLPPPLYYTIMYLQKSPTSNIVAGSSALDGWNNIWGLYNNFLYDQATKEITIVPGSSWVEWSNDGKKILSQFGWDIGILTVETKQFVTFLPSSSSQPTWSFDGEWIYFQRGSNSTWVMRINGLELRLLDNNFTSPRQFNDSLLLGLSEDTLSFFNLRTETKYPCGFDIPNENQRFWGVSTGLHQSPNRKYVLGEVISKHGNPDDAGLYLFDFVNTTASKIFPSQFWGQPYRPRWSSNSTFFATYYCRKDSAAMVYEFDLNGKTLRQVTFKEQRFYP
jgi:hypothetical protein